MNLHMTTWAPLQGPGRRARQLHDPCHMPLNPTHTSLGRLMQLQRPTARAPRACAEVWS